MIDCKSKKKNSVSYFQLPKISSLIFVKIDQIQ